MKAEVGHGLVRDLLSAAEMVQERLLASRSSSGCSIESVRFAKTKLAEAEERLHKFIEENIHD